MSRLLLIAALLLSGCGGGGGGEAPASTPIEATRWNAEADIEGACCNYAALVITDAGTRIYTNAGARTGDLVLYAVGVSRTVLHIDAPADTFIRTVAVVERAGKWFALLESGDAYPGSNGYSPSWATSDDGKAWAWHGPVSPYPRTLSSGGALTVDEQGHFRAWLDVGDELREMRSDDGLTWTHFGVVPTKSVLFATAARTPQGTMLAVADAWPANRIQTLWQCHNGPWRVLEENSYIRNGEKGTALTYHAGLIHAYANGKHWTTAPPECH